MANLFRIEFNLETGVRTEIAQRAYRNNDNVDDVLVLDASETAPSGYTEFDPHAEEQPL